MGSMKDIAITFELIRNNANELLRVAKLAETGKRDPKELISDIQEVATKILHTVNGEWFIYQLGSSNTP